MGKEDSIGLLKDFGISPIAATVYLKGLEKKCLSENDIAKIIEENRDITNKTNKEVIGELKDKSLIQKGFEGLPIYPVVFPDEALPKRISRLVEDFIKVKHRILEEMEVEERGDLAVHELDSEKAFFRLVNDMVKSSTDLVRIYARDLSFLSEENRVKFVESLIQSNCNVRVIVGYRKNLSEEVRNKMFDTKRFIKKKNERFLPNLVFKTWDTSLSLRYMLTKDCVLFVTSPPPHSNSCIISEESFLEFFRKEFREAWDSPEKAEEISGKILEEISEETDYSLRRLLNIFGKNK